MTDPDRRIRRSFCLWASWIAAGLLVAWVTGRLQPHFVPDSPSYLDYPFASAEAMARSIRTPGYPLWLWSIRSTLGIGFVPAAQVVLHASAVFWLCRELRRWRMPSLQVLAVGIAVAVGCTPTDHISTIASDAPTASLGVMLVAALLRWQRKLWRSQPDSSGSESGAGQVGWRADGVVAVILLAILAIMFRPAYLFVVPWLAVVIPLLAHLRGAAWSPAIGAGLFAAAPVLALLLVWMGFRFWAVGDFGILPFGHQNLAGVLVQLVSDEELRALGDDGVRIAPAVVEEKERFLAQGNSFAEGDAGATMTIEARWGAMTYHVVVPASQRVAGEDPVAQHDAVARLNRQIVLRYPVRYLVWLAKAVRRGAWAIAADIVMHPVFLLAIVLAGAMTLFQAVRPGGRRWTVSTPLALRALTVITATYLVAKLGFVVLSSPAIGRFSDAAAIFLPGWLAASYLNLWREPDRQEVRSA